MGKKYNISSKSDMRRFQRDLKSTMLDKAKAAALSRTYSVQCPHCNVSLNIPSGKSNCPMCKEEVDLQLNFNF